MQIDLAKKSDVLEVAQIHKSEINKGFLSFLGIPVLSRFYKSVVSSNNSFCFVARDNNKIVGFVAGSTDLAGFNKYFFKKYLLILILIMISNVFNPFVRKKIKDNFLHLKKKDNLPSAELLAIAIDRGFQGKGLGTNLLQEFISEMKNRNVECFKVLVGKELNLSKFYLKNNFQLISDNYNSHSLIFTYKIN